MEISYSTNQRSHMRYMLRTSLILLLILVPLIMSGCIYHHSDTREPFVYMIDPSDDVAGVRLTIMAAVASFSSMAPDQSVISGKINNSCQLDPHSNMIGDILLVNISSPRCKLLVEDSSFLELLEKSEVAATVILDNTPR